MQARTLLERIGPGLLRELAIAMPLVRRRGDRRALYLGVSRRSICRAGSAQRWRAAIRAAVAVDFPARLRRRARRGLARGGARDPADDAAGSAFPDTATSFSSSLLGVIVVTLIGQGLRAARPSCAGSALPREPSDERRREQDAEIAARADALTMSQRRLDQLAAENASPLRCWRCCAPGTNTG